MAVHNISDERATYDLREVLRKTRKAESVGTVTSAVGPGRKVHIKNTTEEIVISTDDVVVDDTYQRNLSRKWARDIARNFDPNLFGKPLVAPRPDGKFAVIDGQHRIAALRIKWPNEAVTFTADVDPNATTVQHQAKRFNEKNTYTRKTRVADELRALVAACDDDALIYQDILERHGFRTKWGGGSNRPGLVAPAVFKTLVKRNPQTWQGDLDEALALIRAAWGQQEFYIETPIFVGVAMFLRAFRDDPAFNRARCARKLSTMSPSAIYAKSRVLKEVDRSVGALEYGVRRILRDEYNKGASKNKLPEV